MARPPSNSLLHNHGRNALAYGAWLSGTFHRVSLVTARNSPPMTVAIGPRGRAQPQLLRVGESLDGDHGIVSSDHPNLPSGASSPGPGGDGRREPRRPK